MRVAPVKNPSPRLVLFALAVAGLATSMQQTLAIPLLPHLAEAFHTSLSAVVWTATVTLLAAAVGTPLLSRFGDMYGKKPMMIVTMALLVIGSTICALAATLGVLIVGRALQGFSAAVMPLAIGTIRDTFPRERMTTAIGIISATLGLGGSIGMLTTGFIARYTNSYHPVFWIAAAVGLVGLILILFCTRDTAERRGGRPDVPGAIALAGWLVCLLVAITEGNDWGWGSARIIGLLCAAVALCALWVVIERRTPEPLVRLELLVGPKSRTANIAGLMLGFAMFAAFILLANFIQASKTQVGYGLSGSVLSVGLYLIPSAFCMLIFSTLAGRFEARIGAAYTLAIGSALVTLSYTWLAIRHTTGFDVAISSALQGTGIGIGFAALGTLAVEHVPMSETSIASGINSLVRTAGGSISSAVVAAVLSATVVAETSAPSVDGYVICFAIAAAGAGVSAVIATWHGLRYGATREVLGATPAPASSLAVSGPADG